MEEILQQTQALENLLNTPTTKLAFINNEFKNHCVVCDSEIEEGGRVCSPECAQINAYDIMEAEVTGN